MSNPYKTDSELIDLGYWTQVCVEEYEQYLKTAEEALMTLDRIYPKLVKGCCSCYKPCEMEEHTKEYVEELVSIRCAEEFVIKEKRKITEFLKLFK